MKEFLNGNEWYWRLSRTCVEVLLGFLVANGANIMSGYGMDAGTVASIMGIVTAVVSPIIASLKSKDGEDA